MSRLEEVREEEKGARLISGNAATLFYLSQISETLAAICDYLGEKAGDKEEEE